MRAQWTQAITRQASPGTTRARWRRLSIAVAALTLLGTAGVGSAPSAEARTSAADAAGDVAYIPGSTTKICQLTGIGERQTADDYGLNAADHGYSFLYRGRQVFLFGDAQPTKMFNGQYNQNRWSHDTSSIVNDAIATSTHRRADGCPDLEFTRQATPAVGAYANPHVVTASGKELTQKTNESPVAGFTARGRMFVIFKTDNPRNNCTPAKDCFHEPAALGYPFSSVLAVLENPQTMTFRVVSTFSGPEPGSLGDPLPPAGRFVDVAVVDRPGPYLYFFGTAGGHRRPGATEFHRHSYPYLARIPRSRITETTPTGRPAAIRYFAGPDAAGRPTWTTTEDQAVPLFRDDPACMGELGVQYNPYLDRWITLYNCPAPGEGARGIFMRTAPTPWGAWSEPQVIFHPARDGGYCYYIHFTGACPPDAPNPPARAKANGGDYGPYFVAGWTTGRRQHGHTPATSTIYYTIDTFRPYGEVIVKTTLRGTDRTGG